MDPFKQLLFETIIQIVYVYLVVCILMLLAACFLYSEVSRASLFAHPRCERLLFHGGCFTRNVLSVPLINPHARLDF